MLGFKWAVCICLPIVKVKAVTDPLDGVFTVHDDSALQKSVCNHLEKALLFWRLCFGKIRAEK